MTVAIRDLVVQRAPLNKVPTLRKAAQRSVSTGEVGEVWARTVDGGDDADAHMAYLVKSVSAAVAWWVNEDMCALLDSAATSMPAQVALVEDAPDPFGFAVFERPLASIGVMPDGVDRGGMPISALSWGPIITEEDGTPAWRVDSWLVVRGGDSYVVWPVGYAHWRIGATTDDTGPYVAPGSPDDLSHQEDRRRLAALWTLASQELLTEQSRQPLDRSTAAKHRRADLNPSPIRVVRLRRPVASKDPGAAADRHYSHRWMVSGHWRNQYLPSRGTHRLQWIAPYVKGPEDKPLVVKETVKAWTR